MVLEPMSCPPLVNFVICVIGLFVAHHVLALRAQQWYPSWTLRAVMVRVVVGSDNGEALLLATSRANAGFGLVASIVSSNSPSTCDAIATGAGTVVVGEDHRLRRSVRAGTKCPQAVCSRRSGRHGCRRCTMGCVCTTLVMSGLRLRSGSWRVATRGLGCCMGTERWNLLRSLLGMVCVLLRRDGSRHVDRVAEVLGLSRRAGVDLVPHLHARSNSMRGCTTTLRVVWRDVKAHAIDVKSQVAGGGRAMVAAMGRWSSALASLLRGRQWTPKRTQCSVKRVASTGRWLLGVRTGTREPSDCYAAVSSVQDKYTVDPRPGGTR